MGYPVLDLSFLTPNQPEIQDYQQFKVKDRQIKVDIHQSTNLLKKTTQKISSIFQKQTKKWAILLEIVDIRSNNRPSHQLYTKLGLRRGKPNFKKKRSKRKIYKIRYIGRGKALLYPFTYIIIPLFLFEKKKRYYYLIYTFYFSL